MSNLIDMTGWTSGSIKIGSIIQSSPRRYQAACTKCGTQHALDHSAIRMRVDSNIQLECPNFVCRSGVSLQVEKEREYFRQLKQTERDAENARVEALNRARYGQSVEVAL